MKESKKEASKLEAAVAEEDVKSQTTTDILQSIAHTSNPITIYPATNGKNSNMDCMDLIDDIKIMTDAEMMLQAYGRIYK